MGHQNGSMSAHDTSTRPLGGPGSEERLARLRGKFRAAAPRVGLSMRARRRLRDLGRNFLIVYWLACVAVIAAGVNRTYPDLWAKVQQVLPGPAMGAVLSAPLMQSFHEQRARGLDSAFRNCAAARAAGAAPLRVGDPGYGRHLDRDGDGIACEPFRGG